MPAGPAQLCRTMDRDLDAIPPVAGFMRDFASQVLSDEDATAVELSLVEALTNAVKHGGLNGRASGQIVVQGHADTAAFVIEVFDTVPVVPEGMLEQAGAHRFEIDIDDIESLAENGRGLSIMVLCMDEVTLRTARDKYILRMVKYRAR